MFLFGIKETVDTAMSVSLSLPSGTCQTNERMSSDSMILSSACATPCPTHERAPRLKGIKLLRALPAAGSALGNVACVPADALALPAGPAGSHRDGSKAAARSQWSPSRCETTGQSITVLPAATSSPYSMQDVHYMST